MKLYARSLTLAEAKLLHQQIRTTPNILGYTTRELARFRDVRVAEIEGKFAGAVISVDLLFGWTEIAVLYVLEEFRDQHIGSVLFKAAWDAAEKRKRHIFTISRNPRVLKLMAEHGMVISSNPLSMPFAMNLYNIKYMASRYRLSEAWRKRNMGKGDGFPSFQFGKKRYRVEA